MRCALHTLKYYRSNLRRKLPNHEQKKKSFIAYFYQNLVLLLRKYINSMTILKSFEKSLIWVVEQNSNFKTLEVMIIWKK